MGTIKLVSYIVTIITYLAYWKIFVKMGHKGWEGLIPFYRTYILFKELYGNGWKFLLLLIPIYHIYLFIKFYIDLAKAFNKPGIFALGLIFLSPIFLCILGFDEDTFIRQNEC